MGNKLGTNKLSQNYNSDIKYYQMLPVCKGIIQFIMYKYRTWTQWLSIMMVLMIMWHFLLSHVISSCNLHILSRSADHWHMVDHEWWRLNSLSFNCRLQVCSTQQNRHTQNGTTCQEDVITELTLMRLSYWSMQHSQKPTCFLARFFLALPWPHSSLHQRNHTLVLCTYVY